MSRHAPVLLALGVLSAAALVTCTDATPQPAGPPAPDRGSATRRAHLRVRGPRDGAAPGAPRESAAPPTRSTAALSGGSLPSLDAVRAEVLALLGHPADIHATDVPRDGSVFGLAARLATIHARGAAGDARLRAGGSDARFPAVIEFALETDEANAPIAPEARFPPAAGRIYATFSTAGHEDARVFVKWTHLDTRTVHICRGYDIDPAASHGFVWMEPEEDWPLGTYAVEIHAMDRTLRPLAGGRYTVGR